jgi:hypothetical protein
MKYIILAAAWIALVELACILGGAAKRKDRSADLALGTGTLHEDGIRQSLRRRNQ